MGVTRFKGGSAIISSRRGGDLLISQYDRGTGPVPGTGVKNGKWANWGNDNLMPDNLSKIVWDNHNKPELIATQAHFLFGAGPILYIEDIVKGEVQKRIVRDPIIEAFFKKSKIKKYLRRQAWNYSLFGNTFSEFLFTRGRDVFSLKAFDCHYCRAGKIPKGKGIIENYFLSSNWKKPKLDPETGNIKILPAYDESNPTKFSKCIYQGKEGIPGNPYYDPPRWYGTRNWTRVANKLPIFHENGIDNGYNIKYHIQIPQSYFEENFEESERANAEERLYDDMDKFLAGAENPMKAFISRYKKTYDGKPTDGWIITPLKVDLQDTAYKNQFEQSNAANTSGHGIAPSLAGIETQGKLSSGSEMRIAYNIYMALKTPIAREVLLEPLYEIKEINGWNPDIMFGFKDVQLTTLDEKKSGMSETVN